jgi:hypothetical protein
VNHSAPVGREQVLRADLGPRRPRMVAAGLAPDLPHLHRIHIHPIRLHDAGGRRRAVRADSLTCAAKWSFSAGNELRR